MHLQRGPLFDVISRDAHDQATHCSYCATPGPVVVLPLVGIVGRPKLDRDFKNEGNGLWVGLCAECVETMRAALAVGEPS
jgi:hypothetical protein